MLATCEILECGYFGDFLYYDLSDGQEVESRTFDIYDDEDETAQKKTRNKIAKSRLKLQQNFLPFKNQQPTLRSALGAAYSELTPDTISIAMTALEEFSNVGKRSGYDYAGISMKIAKVFERELTIRVFRKWRSISIQKFGKMLSNRLSSMQKPNLRMPINYYHVIFQKRKTDLGVHALAFHAITNKVESFSQQKF